MAVVAGIAGVAGMANAAQYINPAGTGEVLIYPYYSVNNGLNTLYSIVNTTDTTKAVKVRFLEGENSREVLDFNVYLSPYDVWTGALVPTVSTVNDGAYPHAGDASGKHVTSDKSCAPFLTKAGQEFLPYEIDKDYPNNDMFRSRDGHMEVLEMATFDAGTDAAAAADHGATGVPASCGYFDAAWGNNGVWDGSLESETTGGLFGSASLINVDQGLSMTYDAVAVADFWTPGTLGHTEPGDLLPNLNNGDDDSIVFVNGAAVASQWPQPIQAASALFMKAEIYNEYAFDAFVNGKSEWIVTFPTKHQHVNTIPVVEPFTVEWDGFESCDPYTLTIWDREEQQNAPGTGVVSPKPPNGVSPELCYEANVIEFIDPAGSAGATSSIMGSDNLITVSGVNVDHATDNGWARIQFNGASHSMSPISGAGFDGLPVAGFMAQQYTNGGAGEGLLAQYAGLFVHKGQVVSN